MLVQYGAAKPEELAQIGLGHVARQYQTGMAGPAYDGGPDKIATRQAWVGEKTKLGAQRQALGPMGETLSQLDQFEALNKQRGTGGGSDLLNTAAGWIGRSDPRMDTMQGIKSRLQGRARPVGSGSTSDFEQRLYAQGVPGPDKLGPANENIIHHMRATYAEENDRLAAAEAWLDARGTMNGFQDAWTGYLQKEPYTATRGTDVRGIGNRVPWQEFFGVKPATDHGRPGPSGRAPAKPPVNTRALPRVNGGIKIISVE